MSDADSAASWVGRYATRGFTLIEMMITIAVAAILLGLALPSFRGVINNNRVTAEANDLVGALNVARAEAVSRGRPVSVCASADGTACSDSTEWDAGWITFVDGGTAGTVDGSDIVLRAWPRIDARDALTANVNFVRFDSQGVSNAATLFTLKPLSCGGDQRRDIELVASGRISLRRLACSP